jgi:crossover junction endodeoxyribonuclease RusA
MMIELTLPWPPSVNHYKTLGKLRKTKYGQYYQPRVNSAETLGFYYEVYMRCKQQVPSEWAVFANSATISFEVHIDLYPPDKRRMDIDNRIKVAVDSLVHAKVIKDDSQITRLVVQKMEILKEGKVIVRIHPFE